eukprot:128239-Prorocentrum_minimum.AAC.5
MHDPEDATKPAGVTHATVDDVSSREAFEEALLGKGEAKRLFPPRASRLTWQVGDFCTTL